MDRSEVVTLISVTKEKNAYGIESGTESRRDVFVNVQSVTRQEFFDAGQAGLQPQYVFVMFGPDYEGEKVVEYKGKRYSVYRTYARKDDNLELYVEERAGV